MPEWNCPRFIHVISNEVKATVARNLNTISQQFATSAATVARSDSRQPTNSPTVRGGDHRGGDHRKDVFF